MDVFPLMSTAIRLNDFARGSREVGPSFEDSQSNQFRLDQICQIIRAAISDNPGVQHHLVAQRLFDIADKIQRIDKDQGPKHYWRAIADDVALLNSTLDDLQNKSVQFPQLMPFYRFLRSRHLADARQPHPPKSCSRRKSPGNSQNSQRSGRGASSSQDTWVWVDGASAREQRIPPPLPLSRSWKPTVQWVPDNRVRDLIQMHGFQNVSQQSDMIRGNLFNDIIQNFAPMLTERRFEIGLQQGYQLNSYHAIYSCILDIMQDPGSCSMFLFVHPSASELVPCVYWGPVLWQGWPKPIWHWIPVLVSLPLPQGVDARLFYLVTAGFIGRRDNMVGALTPCPTSSSSASTSAGDNRSEGCPTFLSSASTTAGDTPSDGKCSSDPWSDLRRKNLPGNKWGNSDSESDCG